MGISEVLQPESLAAGYPFDRILVPLDGSGSAERILPVLRSLSRQHASQIILVRVVEPEPLDPEPPEESLQLADGYLKQAATGLNAPGIRAKTVARVGSVPESLLAVATEEQASIIAISTHGGTTSDSMPFGTVAGYLLRSSPIPILAIPPHAQMTEARPRDSAAPALRTLLVLTRGEKATDGVVPVAVDFAVSFGADLAILLEMVPQWTTGRGEAEVRVEAENHLATLAHAFESEQIPTLGLIDPGDPVRTILEVAEERKADVIAMSTRSAELPGNDGISPLAEGVLKASKVPVLLSRGR
ncbi:MAG TPA: universal stress protein [Planctomycetota bacterium]|nr:universal stress protein [Planctomycetota bacterium]